MYVFVGLASLAALGSAGSGLSVQPQTSSRARQPLVTKQATVQDALVNAPVAPDAIYVSRAQAGLSVIDLNGFGAGTGDPTYDVAQPILEGNTNFPNNPNVSLQGAVLTPPLSIGSTMLNGGSSGVFTTTRNTAGSDALVSSEGFTDLMLGHPIDLFLNASMVDCNGIVDDCAKPQLLSVDFAGPHGLVPAPASDAIHRVPEGGNPISWAPHPNPPALVPDGCDPTGFAGMEPTSIATLQLGFVNLLAPGNAFGIPDANVPPTGLLARQQNSFFVGPAPAGDACSVFQMRQGIGHFLYALERSSGDLVVLNSNRMTELARLHLGQPIEMAMGPNLDLLAIADRDGEEVVFVDIDPRSASFHQVVQRTKVGARPRGIAWEPGNEDIFVCNEGDDTVSILSARTLEVRKTLTGLDGPFSVAITPRQDRFGFRRNVYFAYILQRSGYIALFESGPGGTNGWGFDDIVLTSEFRVKEGETLQADPSRLDSAVWVVHSAAHVGLVSRIGLNTRTTGVIPIQEGELPNARGLELRMEESFAVEGHPMDIAFDNQSNLGALPNYRTIFSPGTPAAINGKNLVREIPGVGIVPTNMPRYLFVAARNVPVEGGAVHVIDLEAGELVDTNLFQPGRQSIPLTGAVRVMDYFRQ